MREGNTNCPDEANYTCMLWNVDSGQPTVVRILEDRDDRWLCQRCQTTLASFEAPVESFLKSEWTRSEPKQPEPERARSAPDARVPHPKYSKRTVTP